MDKKKVYVCGKVGEKKFEVFRGMSEYVTFYDSVWKESRRGELISDHLDPFSDFDSLMGLLGDGDGRVEDWQDYVASLVTIELQFADLVIGYFNTPDAFGSLVEIGYALGCCPSERHAYLDNWIPVLLVFDKRVTEGKLAADMLDCYRLAVLMPGVKTYFVNPDDSRDRANLFLHVARLLDLDEMPIKKAYLFEIQEGKCNGCLANLPLRNLTIDHVVPRKKGGGDVLENLQLLCQPCNSTKNVGTQEDLVERLCEKGVISDDGSGTETEIR